MNIITGITKTKEKGKRKKEKGNQEIDFQSVTRNPQPATRNAFKPGNCFQLISFLLLTFFFSGCASRQPAQEAEASVKSDVSVCKPVIRSANNRISFQGVTRYMQTNDIRSKMTGIITRVNCAVAENISINQALFTVQPQEAAALQKSKLSSQLIAGLSDTVYSHLSGQIKTLNVQIGDFVQAGDILASCIRTNSMRIIVYIPVEQVSAVEKMKDCMITLPDGSTIGGQVSGKLPAAEAQNQTQAFIIEPKMNISLAENINLTIQFIAETIQNAVFVPQSAVLGNEEQTRFWVMKLINDSTCMKVAVEKGMKVDSLVQLIGSDLKTDNLIISEGGYGLPDSARVKVINAN